MKLLKSFKRIGVLIIILLICGCKSAYLKKQGSLNYTNKIDSLMRTLYKKDLFNGNVLVVKNNKVIYQKSFGFTNGSQQTKLDNKSIFNTGSIAKEFNGIAVMMLHERGLLNINDPISKFNLGLPGWSKKVTIKHLLNYTSGIPKIDFLSTTSDQDAWKILKNSDALLFEPGSSFLYENSNVFLQRKIVEKVTSQSFEDFIVQNIVQPLKMTNSVFDPITDYPNRTSCYDFDKIQCPELEFISGWLWTDINDLYKWISAMNSNALISQESFDVLLRNPYVKGKTSSLGEYYENDKLQVHNGSSYKFESIFLNDFKNDVTIILLSNNLNRVRSIGITLYNLILNKPYTILKKSIYQTIRKESIKDVELGIKTYQQLKKNFPDEYNFTTPSELNRLGNELLRSKKNQPAIKIFQLAASEFLNNVNSLYSLGEAYFKNEQYDLSLSSYQKILKIDQTNENAIKMIDEIMTIQNSNEKIDNYLNNAMQLHNIPGLALAVIQNNQVVYKNYLGKASLEDDTLVNEKTLFRLFSATKLITATGVFQLIEQGKLNLQDEISAYLDQIPQHWQKIKVENLLSHSSGLPDFIRFKSTLTNKELIDKLTNQEMEFKIGSKFSYNQTNYWLLAQIIEKITGESFDDFILNNQFSNVKNGVLFSSNSQEHISNRATRYFYNPKLKQFIPDTNNNGARGHSGNGLNITLDGLINWNNHLDQNKLLNSASKSMMWTPFKFTNKQDDFLYGWGQYPINNRNSYGFSGGNLAAFRKFTKQNTTIILLSNGYQIPAYDIIINDIARMVLPEFNKTNPVLEEDVMHSVISADYKQAEHLFIKLKKENPKNDFDNLKWNINSIANSLTFEDKNQQAYKVYKINVNSNPLWWVARAGLAENHEKQGNNKSAVEYYQQAIRLNTSNQWNTNEKMAKRIKALKID